MSLYDEMIKNIPANEIDSYQSDLYVKVSEKSKKLIDQYEFKANVRRFRSNIDGCQWFDIPFAYSPYWKAKGVN